MVVLCQSPSGSRRRALLIGPIVLLGLFDMLQKKRAILRNFPVIGQLRYLFEEIRPEIQQYFIESNSDGKPFSRQDRDSIYQRSKGELSTGKRREFLAVCKAMVETGQLPDYIAVDGGEGGTGAAPVEFSNSLGCPLVEGLTFVHNALVGCGLRDEIKIIASGPSTPPRIWSRPFGQNSSSDARPNRRSSSARPSGRTKMQNIVARLELRAPAGHHDVTRRGLPRGFVMMPIPGH